MILHRLLDHDLHRAKRGVNATPLWIDIPAKAKFLPAIVSLSTPKFAVSKKLTEDGKIRSGIFNYDSDRIDEIIPDLMKAAYDLSLSQKWPNIFKDPAQAFKYLQKQSGTMSQPHISLLPTDWSDSRILKWAGKGSVSVFDSQDAVDKASSQTNSTVLWRICRVQRCPVKFPVFCSRPDFVGMYTQLVGGKTSILLHNVQAGIAFCP